MKIRFGLFLLNIAFLMFSVKTFCQSAITAGGSYPGKQTWYADTVKITGDVIVNDTLTILPGTLVEFQGHYKITAGVLIAAGTQNDSIIFTIHDTTGFSTPGNTVGGWAGLIVKGISLNYCRIEYVKNIDPLITNRYAIFIKLLNGDILNSVITSNNTPGGAVGIFSDRAVNFKNTAISYNKGWGIDNPMFNNFRLDNCIISHNDRGVSICQSLAKISHSIIEHNKDYGIHFTEIFGHPAINNNIIQHNGTGLSLDCYNSYDIVNNIIRNNQLGISIMNTTYENFISGNLIYGNNLGIQLTDVHCSLYNNLIFNNSNEFGNGAAIQASYSTIDLNNNTIVNNSAHYGSCIYLNSDRSDKIKIYNCILRNNQSEIGKQFYARNYTTGNQTVFPCSISSSNIEEITEDDITGELMNNIDNDPLFTDAAGFDFHLGNLSPCINTGTYDTTGLYLPGNDVEGNPRIVDLYIDMGAYEYSTDEFVITQQPETSGICEGENITLSANANGGVLSYQWQKDNEDITGAIGRILHFESANNSQSGNYICKITAVDSVAYTNEAQITIHALPVVSIGKDTAIHINDIIELDAGVGFVNYLWNTGAETQMIEASHTLTGNYDYSVTVNDNNSCSAADTIMISVVLPDALKDYSGILELKVFPNPAADVIYLTAESNVSKDISVTIIDISGRICTQGKIEQMQSGVAYPFDISGLNNGVYLLLFDGNKVRFIKKAL